MLHRLRVDMNKVGLRTEMSSFVAFDEALNSHPDLAVIPVGGSDPHPRQVAAAVEQMVQELRKRNPRVVLMLLHIRRPPHNAFTAVPLLRAEQLRQAAGRGAEDAMAYELKELRRRQSQAVSPIAVVTEVCADITTPGCGDPGSETEEGKTVPEIAVTGRVAQLLHQHFGLRVMEGLAPRPHNAKRRPRASTVQHDGSVVQGLGLSPIGMVTIFVAPWLLYAAAKWAIAERRADEKERRMRAIASGKFPV